jgi:hypothetical protein
VGFVTATTIQLHYVLKESFDYIVSTPISNRNFKKNTRKNIVSFSLRAEKQKLMKRMTSRAYIVNFSRL